MLDMLPPDTALRQELHNELHARPTGRIRLPALVLQVAVLNQGISRERELEHLRRLSGQGELQLDQLAGTFLRLRLSGGTSSGKGTPSSPVTPWCNPCPKLGQTGGSWVD